MAKPRDTLGRFHEILDALDALAADGDAAEALDDLNAELEDALMLLSETDAAEEPEEYADTLEAIRALAEDYRATEIDGIDTLANRLEELAEDD